MKLVHFSTSTTESYGILDKDHLTCLPTLAKLLNQSLPPKLESFISRGLNEDDIQNLVRRARKSDLAKASLPLSESRLLAPIPTPPKIICLGLNYKDHAAEQAKATPNEPVIFMKPRTSIIGPNQSIIKPSLVRKLDYEAELAIIIGKRCKKVKPEEAESCIFGYTILNDVSARDIQFKDRQWTRGKSFDTFAPTGPCITTTQQIEDPSNLQVRTWVNHELRQNSNTKNMVFNTFEVVCKLSSGMTLEPCDIIATGTPAGVGFAMKPTPKFLQEGDLVEIEIEGIEILRNRVIEERANHL